jgi:hypothetical protein
LRKKRRAERVKEEDIYVSKENIGRKRLSRSLREGEKREREKREWGRKLGNGERRRERGGGGGGGKSIKPRRTRQRDVTCPKDPLIQSIHHHSSFFQFTAQL